MNKNFFAAAAIAFVAIASSAQMADCPMHARHMAAAVDQRHDSLGVSHETTHHSFRLYDDGAAIELYANVASDAPTIDAIRKHLHTIADQFAANDFSTPMFVHGKTPDGVDAIKRLHDRIDFRYESLHDGARVRMKTSDADALAALHAFMKFQIDEHRTGDTGAVEHEAAK